MPSLYVRDSETLDIIAIVEDFLSLVWTERYQESGDFVLDMPISKENILLFKRGRYLSFDQSEETMVIRTVDITESFGSEEEPKLEISGKSLTCFLERRVNASRVTQYHEGTVTYSGKFSEVAQSIANDDIISPIKSYWQWYHLADTEEANESWVPGFDVEHNDSAHNRIMSSTTSDPSRAIPNFVFKNLVDADNDVDISDKYNKLMTVYEVIQSLCKRHLMGFRVVLNNAKKFELQVYSGTDRTSSQKTLSPIIFNPVMDNISYVNYYEDDTNYKNWWFVYIDGYICFRKQMTGDWNPNAPLTIYSGYNWGYLDSSAEGLSRIEIPFESSAVSAKDDNDDGSGNYYTLLDTLIEKVVTDGQDQFEDGEYEILTTSEGAIDPLVRYHYGEDYFMGDRVDITNANGIVMTGIINEVVKSYDQNGIITTPNFMNMTEYDYGYDDSEEVDDQ